MSRLAAHLQPGSSPANGQFGSWIAENETIKTSYKFLLQQKPLCKIHSETSKADPAKCVFMKFISSLGPLAGPLSLKYLNF